MPVSKSKEKHLLVVSFLEGRNFIKRNRIKFIVEAKFDGEQLGTDPVDHQETIEINQELAWELDKKSMHMHRLQRSAIKAICYAVGENIKENIGYVVLDIRSAPEGIGKPKWFNLLQPKYPKLKPSIQINLYVEDNQPVQLSDSQISALNEMRPPPPPILNNNSKNLTLSANNSLNASYDNNFNKKTLKIDLINEGGYFQIEKSTHDCQIYVLTITIAFARHLIRLITDNQHSSASNFYFVYTFLNNQVSTKPFEDIVSCQINAERSSIRFSSTLNNLKTFFSQENDLQIVFYSNDRMLARTHLSWKNLLEKWSDSTLSNTQNSLTIDYLSKLDSVALQPAGRQSPLVDVNMSPVIGVQVGLCLEDSNFNGNQQNVSSERAVMHKSPVQISSSSEAVSTSDCTQQGQGQVVFQNSNTKVTLNEQSKETVLKFKANNNENVIPVNSEQQTCYITQEMQLKAAYEIEMWKEAREKEFEQMLTKMEAKKFQALADAFKQHDTERETIVQKKLKEYNELEVVLKNSLSEVEKREKKLSLNESQVARLKADLHHEYENKLLELREASKRVQEKADHQVQLQKSKCENFEEDIHRLKRQINESEKKFSDKEGEFLRYKERENSRPEIRLQSELNMLNLEKLEMDRKLDSMLKAKNHYKEQWSKALCEIGNIKKKEEASAKATLKKQQMELEHLRLRYLAAEENELIKNDEKQLISLKKEVEKLKLNSQRSTSCDETTKSTFNMDSAIMDHNLKDHIERLSEERDTLLRTGCYSNTDAIIIELDKRIRDCYKESKSLY